MDEHEKATKPPCPCCGHTAPVARAGLNNKGGNRRYRCQRCRMYFTVEPWSRGHDPALREQAVRMFREGGSLRAIGRVLGVHHQSVANWIKGLDALPEP